MAIVVLRFPRGLLRHALAALLEHEGHSVRFSDEPEAQHGLWRKRPDLAIAGPESIPWMARLRAEWPRLPIIAIGLPEGAGVGATIALPSDCGVAEFRDAVRWTLCASGTLDRLRASGAIEGARS